MGKLIPPVVAAGAMAGVEQPGIAVDDEVLLRPFEPGDVAAVREAFTTPDIEHWHFRRYETDDEAAGWIDECGQGWRDERCATWAVVDRAEHRVGGRVSLYTHLENGWGEVAYWLLPSARGRGLATRACVAATRWAHELGLHRVELEHSTRNPSSARVARRAGFTPEGVRRAANLHADGWHDMQVHAHLSSEPFAPSRR